ncbi:transposase, IS4 family protein [Rippkaea orientalis PCC 8801]|uniref:Transposase, IS4 family protein n=1 Tax=Rippkaea orientalis (strain PCC 8801 / RF-1) TaxID=41431 RepID=B7K4Z5_RIPO1|nr:transposase, IS4 family protein [Rippkaea orientalis PCC 8801]
MPDSSTFLSLQLSDRANKETINRQNSSFRHSPWNDQNRWKNILNNLRLVIQSTLLLWLLSPCLDIFPNLFLCLGFHDLINAINQFQPFYAFG